MKAINECLPRNPPGELPKDIAKRNTLHITRIDCEYYQDLNVWFSDVSKEWQRQQPKKPAAARDGYAAGACLSQWRDSARRGPAAARSECTGGKRRRRTISRHRGAATSDGHGTDPAGRSQRRRRSKRGG